jgi:hypothetical protein
MSCPLGYGRPRSLYDDSVDAYDDPDGAMAAARAGAVAGPAAASMAALAASMMKGAGGRKPVKPRRPGLCDSWFIRIVSAVTTFFVTAACLHTLFRWYQPISEYLVWSQQRFDFTDTARTLTVAPPMMADALATDAADAVALSASSLLPFSGGFVDPPANSSHGHSWSFAFADHATNRTLRVVLSLAANRCTAAGTAAGTAPEWTGALHVSLIAHRQGGGWSAGSGRVVESAAYALRSIVLAADRLSAVVAAPDAATDLSVDELARHLDDSARAAAAAAAPDASAGAPTAPASGSVDGVPATPSLLLTSTSAAFAMSALLPGGLRWSVRARPASGLPLWSSTTVGGPLPRALSSLLRRQLFDPSLCPGRAPARSPPARPFVAGRSRDCRLTAAHSMASLPVPRGPRRALH